MRKLLTLTLLIFFTFFPVKSASAQITPNIEIANSSGPAGFQIGIFGTGFGTAQGSVQILGVNAEILEWQDTFIRTVVPSVADGQGQIEVSTANGQDSWDFEVYTVNPDFLVKPQIPEYLSHDYTTGQGKLVYYYNYDSKYLLGNSPTTDLSRNYSGGAVNLNPNSIVAIDLEQNITGPVWFAFDSGSANWFTFSNSPQTYTIQGSTDSTDGMDGNWETFVTVNNNDRPNRVHKIENMNGNRWIRLNVSSIINGSTYRIREIRVFNQQNYNSNQPLNYMTVFGDSNTANDMSLKTSDAGYLPAVYFNQTGDPLVHNALGLSGAKSNWLHWDNQSDPLSLTQAMLQNPDTYYWAFAFGTNDSTGDTDCTGNRENWWYVCLYDQNLEDGIENVTQHGKVPIISRLPYTDYANGGFGSAESQAYLLADTDRLYAQYRLIPGPDFYTEFRYNFELGGDTYISDGTHHTPTGAARANQMWAETISNLDIYGNPPTSTPTPTDSCTRKGVGDANCDDVINIQDYVVISNTFGSTTDLRADFDNNNTVNIQDYIILSNNFGSSA